MKKILLLIFPCFLLYAEAQETKNYNIDGYISIMGSVKKQEFDTLIKSKDVLIHNRINFEWYPSKNLTFSLSIRNRFIYDETYSEYPNIENQFEKDIGYMQLSKNLFYDNDLLLNSSIDRLNLKYTKRNFEINIGRQRINWSQSFAWNPNDIFNASSYFDFDYPEKPGSDAVRIQYYTGMASSAEIVTKIDNLKKITAAALYRMNIKSYDFQVLSGIMNEEEFVLGTGWNGNINKIGFRGEITSLIPFKDSSLYNHPMDDLIMIDMGCDYTFSNSASFMCEALYSNIDSEDLMMMFSSSYSLISNPVTVRNLAFSRMSVLLSGSYPVHPLVNISVSGMYFYKITGYYTGPSIDFSVTNNINLSFYWQYFNMLLSKENELFDDISINYIFLRLKYNF